MLLHGRHSLINMLCSGNKSFTVTALPLLELICFPTMLVYYSAPKSIKRTVIVCFKQTAHCHLWWAVLSQNELQCRPDFKPFEV